MNVDIDVSELPWLKHYDKEVPFTLEYPEIPIFEILNKSVQNYPERTALIFFGKKITYRDLGRYVEALSNSLKRLGVEKGVKVALLLPNCPQYVITYFAVLRLGGTVVPVNPLSTERELKHIFCDAGVRVVVALDRLGARIENVRKLVWGEGGLEKGSGQREAKLLEHVIYTSVADFLPFPLNLLYPLRERLSTEAKAAVRKGIRFRDLLKGLTLRAEHLSAESSTVDQSSLASSSGKDDQKPSVDVHRDIAVLIYTSGTTGVPKGVMLSHYALIVNASHCVVWGSINADDRMLAVLPLFHGFGMSVCMNAPIMAGASLVLVPRFDAGEVLKIIRRHRPTLFAGVPTMIVALINQPELKNYDLSSLRACYVGAASLPPEVKKQFEELTRSRLMEGYGLTEAVTAKCANPYRGLNKTGSIGIPFPDTVMRVVDTETGKKVLGPNEIGEIVLRSPDIMLGYYNQPESTAQAIRDGWLYTGDLGYMDEDGYFYIVERKKDMIITGGFNVYPREVEDVLYTHPAVKEACVVGAPDEYRGEAVVAFVVLREGETADEEELKNYCRQHLTPYKVPRVIEFRTDLPKSAIGKILRKELRRELQERAAKEKSACSSE